MKRKISLFLFTLASFLMAKNAFGSTWYVRPDGGTRYSTNMTSGQCNGKSDAAYSGVGVNQNCAFKDVRYFWQDGAYTTSQNNFPAYGWIGTGGDTYLIRGSIGTGVSYRLGWNNPNNAYDDATAQRWGVQGDPSNSGAPVPPSGTAAQPTRILGENYQSCSVNSAKTQLHGGYGLGVVLNLAGASYVDAECLDITDYAQCGLKSGHTQACENIAGADYAGTGVYWNRNSTHDTLNNVSVHGMGQNGMQGPTGDGVVMTNISILGNGASGWNADNGDGTTGTGSLLVQQFNISWNGCVEEYPTSQHTVPYGDCTDDGSQGYGDGFGTATVTSSPAWNASFDQGISSYNTQDGLDALHLIGTGSSMTITRVLAYGNMGQQIKIGGANGTAENNVIYTNCNAMRYAIPGTPSDYNTKLSDFCRAADSGIKVDLGLNSITTLAFNTIYSASSTGIDIECGPSGCDSTSKIDYRDNIFIGFTNDAAHGYPNGGTGDYSNPIYDGTGLWPFQLAGSHFSNNITFHPKSNWKCPTPSEVNAFCVDPLLTDETWHNYGYGDATPLSSSPAIGAGTVISNIVTDFLAAARTSTPTIGAIQSSGTANSSTGTSSSTGSSSGTDSSSSSNGSSSSSSSTSSSSSSSSSNGSSSSSSSTKTTTSATVTTLSMVKGLNSSFPVILTATVKSVDPTKTPTGTVAIYTSNKTFVIMGNLNSRGQVSWIVPKALSQYTIYAVYSGSKTLLSSTSAQLNEATTMAALYSK